MTDNILVLDLETTGLDGFRKGDKIVEVGIVNVDLKRDRITPLFSAPIHYDELTPEEERSWIFTEGPMTPDDVYGSPIDEEKAAYIVSAILDSELVTSYNTKFDFDRFLVPWLDAVIPDELDFCYFRAPCLMRACAQVPDIPKAVHDDGCWPSLASSYYTMCEQHDTHPQHRAVHDSIRAGEVLLALHDRGLYDPERMEEY